MVLLLKDKSTIYKLIVSLIASSSTFHRYRQNDTHALAIMYSLRLKKPIISIVILAFFAGKCFVNSAITFDNYRVFSVNVSNEDQLKVLRNLEESLDYDFWKSPSKIGNPATVMVPPRKANAFAKTLELFQLDATIMIDNVQK